MSPMHAVRTAIEARLATLAIAEGVGTLSIPVYAHPPQGAAMPYVSMDRTVAVPEDLVAQHQSRVRVTMTCWSAGRGARQVESMLDAMHGLLHDHWLETDEGDPVMCKVEFADATRDQDGVTYMGSMIVVVTIGH